MQRLDQRERRPRLQYVFLMLDLIRLVGVQPLLLKDTIFGFQVKERP